MEFGDTQRFFIRIGTVIALFTLLLTASFIGFLAALEGHLTAFEARIPWYLVGGALTFVGTIVLLEVHDAPGRTIIVTATVVGVLTFVLLLLGVEGFLFALANPGEVLGTLVLYIFAAALLATGVGYWGLKHWREFTAQPGESL